MSFSLFAHATHWLETIAMVSPVLVLPLALFVLIRVERNRTTERNQTSPMYSPARNDLDILIVGSGFAGLCAAIALRRAGREDFAVLERADSLGGTWRDNTYPGCGCDVPTPLYSYSFAPNPEWSHFYAKQDEIRAYMEDCADRFGVRGRSAFGAEVTSAVWHEEEQRWRIGLKGGEELSARIVLGGVGGLTRPAIPDIPGLEDFGGDLMHSAAWDHSVDLDGKRIAVIGTGASSIQLAPQVAKIAEHVDVFQRTAAWVFPKIDVRFGRFAKAMFRRFPTDPAAALRGRLLVRRGTRLSAERAGRR